MLQNHLAYSRAIFCPSLYFRFCLELHVAAVAIFLTFYGRDEIDEFVNFVVRPALSSLTLSTEQGRF